MNPVYAIDRLAGNRQVFEGLLAGVADEQARWKPAPEKWSLLEVVNHLYDEERDDFRMRLRLLLDGAGERWPPIDPPQWVIERRYNERELRASLADLLGERERSLDWLKGLAAPDWEARYDHPQGVISAGDLLASWLAHDCLHIRQLARLHWEYLSEACAPYSTAYAGQW